MAKYQCPQMVPHLLVVLASLVSGSTQGVQMRYSLNFSDSLAHLMVWNMELHAGMLNHLMSRGRRLQLSKPCFVILKNFIMGPLGRWRSLGKSWIMKPGMNYVVFIFFNVLISILTIYIIIFYFNLKYLRLFFCLCKLVNNKHRQECFSFFPWRNQGELWKF